MAVQFKDYYQTLGVAKSATEDEIRKAFRSLARKHHPDMVKPREKAEAESKFKEINEAYEVLSDPEKRQRYDSLGADWERGPQPGARGFRPGTPGGPGGMDFEFGGTGFSDFFEQFFGGRGGRGARGDGFFQGAPEAERNLDVEADILVTLEEAVQGSLRPVTLRRADETKPEKYNVRIPAGVREGQRIRLAGRGNSSRGRTGDLYLNVRLARHPDFVVEGGDLVHELQLAPWEAVLGTQRSVPTLGGRVNLKVPAGVQHGKRLRLKGHGLPAGKDARGDLFVKLAVVIPTELTAAQRELWEKLAKSSG